MLKAHIVLNKTGKDLEAVLTSPTSIEAMEVVCGECILLNTSISSALMNYVFDANERLDISEHFMPNLMIQEYSPVMRDKAFLKSEAKEKHIDSGALDWNERVQRKLDKIFLRSRH